MKKQSQPLVSVNIRTFNSEKIIEKTLKSIKSQVYKNIEILVSDGFSKDNSVTISKKYGAKVNFADKLGDARIQNYKKSRGKYILSLDSDQVLDRNLIKECVELCEKKSLDALSIAEKSLIQKGNYLENLLAYDKWLIDKNRDDDLNFGTACPRFFRKFFLNKIHWPQQLAIFDDTILYAEILEKGAKVDYLSSSAIRHHEVTSWITLIKKFQKYGKGYLRSLKERPATIMAHSLPRRSYFSKWALSKPRYLVGLVFLYFVKAMAAFSGILISLFEEGVSKKP